MPAQTDQVPIHKTQVARDTLSKCDTDVVYVPAGSTSLLQLADVYWNRPFKAELRTAWEAFILKDERALKGKLRKLSRQDVLCFISQARAAVSVGTVTRSFTGRGISNALNSSEDGALHTRLSGVGDVPPEDHRSLQAECADLTFV